MGKKAKRQREARGAATGWTPPVPGPADAPRYASDWWPPTPLGEPRPGLGGDGGMEAAMGRAPDTRDSLAADAGPERAADAVRGTRPPAGALSPVLSWNQRRLLTSALALAVLALVFVVVDEIGGVILQFGDLLLTFFLAWLVAFILGGPINAISRAVPRLPRGLAVALVYLVVLGAIGAAVVSIAAALATSISDLVEQIPAIRQRLPEIVAPLQDQLAAWGLVVNLATEIDGLVGRLGASAATLVGPLQAVAFASLGALGTTLLVVIFSIYIALDSAAIHAFTLRVIPPAHHDEWRRFEISVSQAFGGFLRGQVGLGLVFGAIAAGVSLALGLEFLPVTTAASALLQMVPFFGPFVSWMPPVLVAIATRPDAIVPALVGMAIGWFVVMNVLQPRVMNAAIGLHPIVVLASVLVGSKLAGPAGAVFGIPVAAVISAMFVYYFRIFGERESRG